jgi:transposase
MRSTSRPGSGGRDRCGQGVGDGVHPGGASVPAGSAPDQVGEVPATTGAIGELAGQLAGLGIQQVTVASTADPWRPRWVAAAGGGLSVQLVNAHQVKHVPGRPRTDRLDAVWLAKLTERGMLRPSVVPPPVIRRWRDDTRLRADLTQRAPGTISGWSSCWRMR